MKITKIKAFLIHMGISLAIFFALLVLIIFVWYPFPLFDIDGGWRGIGIIIAVDLVLGPLLTLIVFRPGKPGLKLDMSLIALFQVIALSLGIGVIYGQRPVLMVFADDRFFSFTEEFLPTTRLKREDFNKFTVSTPPFAIVRMPHDEDKRFLFNFANLGFGGTQMRSDLYEVKNDENLKDMLAHGTDIMPYIKKDEMREKKLQSFLLKNNVKDDEIVYFPLHGRYKAVFLALSKVTGEFIDTIDIDPRDIEVEAAKVKLPEKKK